MKELFVSAGSRGNGVGKALIQAVARVAVEGGHKRVDWTADRTDSGLLGFYSGLGALAQPEKVFYRLTGDALTSLQHRGTADFSARTFHSSKRALTTNKSATDTFGATVRGRGQRLGDEYALIDLHQ
jgi:hypothetical protein